jgi:hypothetical protein
MSVNTIETITLTGKDEVDLNRKQWEWQTGGPTDVVIVKRHPDVACCPRHMRGRMRTNSAIRALGSPNFNV